jgi:ActR/RegA family two-component response regulator
MCDPRSLLLIIEDDAWTQAVLARLMERHGWRILTASTVAEGIDRLRLNPACVILDLDLPDGRGESVLRSIREARARCHVVVCTAGTEARLDWVSTLSPHAILRKPIDVGDLLDACGQDRPTNPEVRLGGRSRGA